MRSMVREVEDLQAGSFNGLKKISVSLINYNIEQWILIFTTLVKEGNHTCG